MYKVLLSNATVYVSCRAKKRKINYDSAQAVTAHFVEFDIFFLWLQNQRAEIKWITMGKGYFRGSGEGKRIQFISTQTLPDPCIPHTHLV